MNRLIFSVAAIALLGGCAHGVSPEPEVRTQLVYVDKAVTCVPENLGDPETYPDTDAALVEAEDAAARYALIWAGRLLRMARLGEVEPVIATCREVGSE